MKLLLTILFLSVAVSGAHAQTEEFTHDYVGIEAGFGQHTQSGTFTEPCGCGNDFKNAKGSGLELSGLFEHAISERWRFGLKATLDAKHVSQSVRSINQIQYQTDSSYDTLNNFITENSATTTTTYIRFTPYAHFSIFSGLFLEAGPGISLLTSSHFSSALRVVSPDSVGGRPVTFASTGTNQENLEDESIPDVNSVRWSAVMSVGWEIPLGPALITPLVTYDLALSTIRTPHQSGWKISSLYGAIAVKLGL